MNFSQVCLDKPNQQKCNNIQSLAPAAPSRFERTQGSTSTALTMLNLESSYRRQSAASEHELCHAVNSAHR